MFRESWLSGDESWDEGFRYLKYVGQKNFSGWIGDGLMEEEAVDLGPSEAEHLSRRAFQEEKVS